MDPRCLRTDWAADCRWTEKVPGKADCLEHGGRPRSQRDRRVVLSRLRAKQQREDERDDAADRKADSTYGEQR